MFTWTENAYESMWKNLRFLANKSNVRRLLSGEMNQSRPYEIGDEAVLYRKSDQIAMCIAQAYEFYQAAETSSIMTSPLLYYYGMLSLSKALIVANVKDIFIEDIEYHGLHSNASTDRLKKYTNYKDKWTVEDQYAISSNGVFKHLCDVLDCRDFESGSIFRFVDTVEICPETSGTFRLLYGSNKKVFKLYSYDKKDGIVISTTDEHDAFKNISKKFESDFVHIDEKLHDCANQYKLSKGTILPKYLGMYQSKIGGRYIIGGLKHEINGVEKELYVNQAIGYYIGMFILSINVRYKQDFWGNQIQGGNSGAITLIEEYVNVAKRVFPNIILDELFKDSYSYGQPARLQ